MMRRVDNRPGRYPEFPSDDGDEEVLVAVLDKAVRWLLIGFCLLWIGAMIVFMVVGAIKLGNM